MVPLHSLQEKQNQRRSIIAKAMLQRMVVTDSLRQLRSSDSLGSLSNHSTQVPHPCEAPPTSRSTMESVTNISTLSASTQSPNYLLQKQRQQQNLLNDLRARQIMSASLPTIGQSNMPKKHTQLQLLSSNTKASINHGLFSKKTFDEAKLRMSEIVRATPTVTKAGRPSTLSGIDPKAFSNAKGSTGKSASTVTHTNASGIRPLTEYSKSTVSPTTVGELLQQKRNELVQKLREQQIQKKIDLLRQLQGREQPTEEVRKKQRLVMLVNELHQRQKQQVETQQFIQMLQLRKQQLQQQYQKQNVQSVLSSTMEQRSRSNSEGQYKIAKPMSAFDYYFQDEYNNFLDEMSNASENDAGSTDGLNKSSRKRKRESKSKAVDMEMLEKLVRDRWIVLERNNSPKVREYRVKEMEDLERYRAEVDNAKRKKIEFFNPAQRRAPN